MEPSVEKIVDEVLEEMGLTNIMDKNKLYSNISDMLLEGEMFCPFCNEGRDINVDDGDSGFDGGYTIYNCNGCHGTWRAFYSRITEIDMLTDGDDKAYDVSSYLSEYGLENGKITFKVVRGK